MMEPEPWDAPATASATVAVVPTSDVVVLSSVHGRRRRAERDIDKRDLQAAVKYGVCKELPPRWNRRRRRYNTSRMYTFANVCYITDETGTKEITSYVEPVQVDSVPITGGMRLEHEKACLNIAQRPDTWTSHTVIVIDQSGSMKRHDIKDCRNRADAVWVCLCLDWIAPQLEKGEAKATDVVSLVAMNDTATTLLRHQPLDWLLYNKLLQFREDAVPRSHGDYLPALSAAETLFHENRFGGCALQLFFLSDGKPSDPVVGSPSRDDQAAWKTLSSAEWDSLTKQHAALATARVGRLASCFGRRLTVGTIGVGNAPGDFEVLRAISSAAEEYGATATFAMPSLTSQSLGLAMTSLASSLTDTRTEMTVLGGSRQRVVREVQRERHGTIDDSSVTDEWWYYPSIRTGRKSFIKLRTKWSLDKNDWDKVDVSKLQSADSGAIAVAYHKAIMPNGEGAERMVHRFREVLADGGFIGPRMVAKESRFVEEDDFGETRDFHKVFCETQAQAQRLAQKFNEKLKLLQPHFAEPLPRVEFLECSVYLLHDSSMDRDYGVLVEKMLVGTPMVGLSMGRTKKRRKVS